MGKHQIMSVSKEARGTFACDMFATWVGGKCRQRNVVYRRSHCGLRVCGRNESFGIVFCRVLSVFESDWLHWLQDGRFDDGTEQNIFSILDDFVILSRPRGPDLESAVDKKEAFIPFFVCFRDRAGRIWSRRQTKKRYLFRFLSAFESARPDFGESSRQKSHISPVFCLLSPSNFKADYGQKTVFQILPVNC